MTIPPLCIIQARMGSTRLPGKMLLPLHGETLIARAWRVACEAFGGVNVVVAIPASDGAGPLGAELRRISARTYYCLGDEADVLGRFWVVASSERWHPHSVIVRYTPDDPWKSVECLRRVASGCRWIVETSGEAFTLEQLRDAHHVEPPVPNPNREHITYALFKDRGAAPDIADAYRAALGGVVTIDTLEDYEAALAVPMAARVRMVRWWKQLLGLRWPA